MHPSPISETSGPCCPSMRVFIVVLPCDIETGWWPNRPPPSLPRDDGPVSYRTCLVCGRTPLRRRFDEYCEALMHVAHCFSGRYDAESLAEKIGIIRVAQIN